MSGQPLVSVVLSTRNRREMFAQAMRCFQNQTYPNRELIVADASDEPIEDLCLGVESVRYLRMDPATSWGACLNAAIETSGGTIVQRIDDDDYYHPRFLERSVSALSGRDDRTIVAWCCFYVLLAGSELLRHSGHGWAAGSTLAFHRATWERTRFREERVAEDYFFLKDSEAVVSGVCAPELFVLVRHGSNSWREMGTTSVDAYFGSIPVSGLRIEDVVDASAVAFYRGLKR